MEGAGARDRECRNFLTRVCWLLDGREGENFLRAFLTRWNEVSINKCFGGAIGRWGGEVKRLAVLFEFRRVRDGSLTGRVEV